MNTFIKSLSILLLLANTCWGAISVGSCETDGDNVTTSSFTNVVARYVESTNDILVVGITARDQTTLADTNVTSVTWNGDALTKAVDKTDTQRNTEIWYIVNPDAGNDLQLVATFAGTVDRGTMNYCFMSGVDQTTPVDVTTSASGISGSYSTINITSASIDSVLFDVVYSDAAAFTTPAATGTGTVTERANLTVGAGADMVGTMTQVTINPGVYNTTWTFTTSLQDWCTAIVALKKYVAEVTSGGTTTYPGIMMIME